MIRMKKATVPKDSVKNIQQAVKKAATNLGKRVGKQYDELTGNWNDPPEFTQRVDARATRTTVEVKTLNKKYRWVNLGTKPHPIDPKPDNPIGLLVFQKDYTAATRPRSLETRRATKSGPTIFAKHVEHPGSEPRHFEIPIIEEQKPLTREEFRDLLKATIKIEMETYGI